MDSVFYKYGHKKRFPVTYLFLELFSKSVENSDNSEMSVAEAITLVLAALDVRDPDTELLTQIAEDITAIEETIRKKQSTAKPTSNKGRNFGTEFLKWFNKMGTEQVLLLLADFDYTRAVQLYCEVPAEVVDRMVELKLGYEWTHAEAQFEAVLFGMGGKIKGGSSDADKSFDEPKSDADDAARNAALKNLGFM